ncbi:hypothetical protein BH11PLA1_BH11PLA1_08470 [soil metagenome]
MRRELVPIVRLTAPLFLALAGCGASHYANTANPSRGVAALLAEETPPPRAGSSFPTADMDRMRATNAPAFGGGYDSRSAAMGPRTRLPAVIALACVGYDWNNAFQVKPFGPAGDAVSLNELKRLPQVRDVVMLDPLAAGDSKSINDVRRAAAELGADVLVLVSVDPVHKPESAFPGVALVTLGMVPDRNVQVDLTAAALMIDVATGTRLGVARATADASRVSNAWGANGAGIDAETDAARDAYRQLVGEMKAVWCTALRDLAQPVREDPVAPRWGYELRR